MLFLSDIIPNNPKNQNTCDDFERKTSEGKGKSNPWILVILQRKYSRNYDNGSVKMFLCKYLTDRISSKKETQKENGKKIVHRWCLEKSSSNNFISFWSP